MPIGPEDWGQDSVVARGFQKVREGRPQARDGYAETCTGYCHLHQVSARNHTAPGIRGEKVLDQPLQKRILSCIRGVHPGGGKMRPAATAGHPGGCRRTSTEGT